MGLSVWETGLAAVLASLWVGFVVATTAELRAEGATRPYGVSRFALSSFLVGWVACVTLAVYFADVRWIANDPTSGASPWLVSAVRVSEKLAPTLVGWLLFVWCLVAVWRCLGLLREHLWVRNCRMQSVAIDARRFLSDHVRIADALEKNRAGLARCALVTQPCATGWRSPLILLPIALDSSLSETETAAVVAHELAHIERKDPFWNVGLQLLRIVFWFNPAVGRLVEHYERSREYECDRRALRYVRSKSLAAALGRLSMLPGQPINMLSAVSDFSSVPGRMRILLQDRPPARRLFSSIVGLVVVTLIVFSVASFAHGARSFGFTRLRASYLTGDMRLDLDELTYEVCSYLSSNALAEPGQAVTFWFDEGELSLNGVLVEPAIRERLTSIFQAHGVRLREGTIFRYHQADTEIGSTLSGTPRGEHIGQGDWLTR
ncbi:MAG: M56 family metallopeptidase [Myxococcota bacterium]